MWISVSCLKPTFVFFPMGFAWDQIQGSFVLDKDSNPLFHFHPVNPLWAGILQPETMQCQGSRCPQQVKEPGRLTVHLQWDNVTSLNFKAVLYFTQVRPWVLPLDNEDGEGLFICRQLHALIPHKWRVVGGPVDGGIISTSVTVEDCHIPLLCDNALTDCEGGLGL